MAKGSPPVRELGGEAVFFARDMGGLTAIDGMVENALDAFRQLDILHNNTSGAVPGAASDIDPEEWDRSLRLGLRPFWYAIRWALPHMIGGGGGSFVNTSSISDLFADHGLAPTTR